MDTSNSQSFFVRHEFLIRRLHSLSGLIPVGAYMVVHLATNASVLSGAEAFQKNVDTIHSLGIVLPLVEWVFIFLPLLFHGIVGLFLVSGAVPNTRNYPYPKNYRYFLQRITGVIAFLFIFFHVFHMHHYGTWLNFGATEGQGFFARFNPEAATTSAAAALSRIWVQILYAVGVLSCVYHLANGIWTMGITWGIWITPQGQRRAEYLCGAFGAVVAVVGLSALWGMTNAGTPQAQAYEKVHREREREEERQEEEVLDQIKAEKTANSATASGQLSENR